MFPDKGTKYVLLTVQSLERKSTVWPLFSDNGHKKGLKWIKNEFVL